MFAMLAKSSMQVCDKPSLCFTPSLRQACEMIVSCFGSMACSCTVGERQGKYITECLLIHSEPKENSNIICLRTLAIQA